jgi:hypothetical protein
LTPVHVWVVADVVDAVEQKLAGLPACGGVGEFLMSASTRRCQYIEPANAPLWSGLSTPSQPDPELARQRRRLQQRFGLVELGLSTGPHKRV